MAHHQRVPRDAEARAITARIMAEPVAGDEATVAELVAFVHANACVEQVHDELCNTMRLLYTDWQQLQAPPF